MPGSTNSPQSSPFEIVSPIKSRKVNSKSFAIVLVIMVFLGVSVFLGVYLVGQQANVSEKAAPATAIYITPGTQSKAPGSSFSFTVNMDTSTNSVTGVDTRLVFNPSVMQIISIQQGAGVTNLNQTIANTYDNATGTLNYAIFTLNGSNAVQGSGIEVLKVNAQVVNGAAAGSYTITFDPATAASASQEGQNVLVSRNQGTIVVTGTSSGSTATPTPTPTGTRTATPTATATATGNSTATPTPAPTQSPTSVPATSTPLGTQSTPIPIPDSGTDWPTFVALGFGLLTIIAAFTMAL